MGPTTTTKRSTTTKSTTTSTTKLPTTTTQKSTTTAMKTTTSPLPTTTSAAPLPSVPSAPLIPDFDLDFDLSPVPLEDIDLPEGGSFTVLRPPGALRSNSGQQIYKLSNNEIRISL